MNFQQFGEKGIAIIHFKGYESLNLVNLFLFGTDNFSGEVLLTSILFLHEECAIIEVFLENLILGLPSELV